MSEGTTVRGVGTARARPFDHFDIRLSVIACLARAVHNALTSGASATGISSPATILLDAPGPAASDGFRAGPRCWMRDKRLGPIPARSLGTPNYLAPEAGRGPKRRKSTTATDVLQPSGRRFSMNCITGRPPFQDERDRGGSIGCEKGASRRARLAASAEPGRAARLGNPLPPVAWRSNPPADATPRRKAPGGGTLNGLAEAMPILSRRVPPAAEKRYCALEPAETRRNWTAAQAGS
jgi:serine/threonine protein kinase